MFITLVKKCVSVSVSVMRSILFDFYLNVYYFSVMRNVFFYF